MSLLEDNELMRYGIHKGYEFLFGEWLGLEDCHVSIIYILI